MKNNSFSSIYQKMIEFGIKNLISNINIHGKNKYEKYNKPSSS